VADQGNGFGTFFSLGFHNLLPLER
jgi:hypothetical protein